MTATADLVENLETKRSFPPDHRIGTAMLRETIERGLVIRVKADTYALASSIAFTSAQLDRADAIRAVLD